MKFDIRFRLLNTPPNGKLSPPNDNLTRPEIGLHIKIKNENLCQD